MPEPPVGSAIWRYDVLRRLRAPRSAVNLEALQLWAASEGMPAEYHNWLATTMDCCGGVSVNSVGVKRYPTIDDGVAATVRTLRLGYYTDVVRALREDAGIKAIWQAVNESKWCSGCQKGFYPVALWQRVGGVRPGEDPILDRQQTEGAIDYSEQVELAGKQLAAKVPRTRDAIDALRGLRRR